MPFKFDDVRPLNGLLCCLSSHYFDVDVHIYLLSERSEIACRRTSRMKLNPLNVHRAPCHLALIQSSSASEKATLFAWSNRYDANGELIELHKLILGAAKLTDLNVIELCYTILKQTHDVLMLSFLFAEQVHSLADAHTSLIGCHGLKTFDLRFSDGIKSKFKFRRYSIVV